VPVREIGIMAAFGCNFAGPIQASRVLEAIGQALEIAAEHDIKPERVRLSDTMAWATPLDIRNVVSAVRETYPDLEIILHLHDTRGMAVANAFAALEMGVASFDSAVAGLGGCPFAGQAGAAGNICTEDLVFLCEEMGIDTGVDLDRLIEAARLAERIFGRELPGSVMHGGTLSRFRKAA
jgi:hydroxymethylglutaryl-CoA lyase